ncbi:hypothetical protein [Actinophytocola xanthii]|uniref:Uncharacterized protein n=1 Tax=Actinophytocola xanthii TaxID=1912961 RepID=A0A1Q8CP08_9PSEU|nr:hypothetical protein [Actinophytocola xanthii]OLF16094.1 hypothetical protein BU204_18240 [Actinophytocola xanthii]
MTAEGEPRRANGKKKILLAVLGFVLASVAVGVLVAHIEVTTGQTWPRWPLGALVVGPAVILLLRHVDPPSK